MNKSMIWPCAVVGLLGMNVVIVGITVYFAAVNSTMVPEPGYYERAVRFDEQIAQRTENDRLGWTASATLFTPAGAAPRLFVRLVDRDGSPVTGAQVHAEAIPNLKPKSRATVVLTASPDDEYSADLPSRQHGLWTVRIEARRGGEVYTAEVSTMMPGATAMGGALR